MLQQNLGKHTRQFSQLTDVLRSSSAARGGRLAISTGGQLTGRGGDIIIIDDPLKADEAHSESALNKCAEWVRTTLMSRFDNPAAGAVVLVMQRLHVDDLAGVLLETGCWEHLNLSAIAEEDERVPTGATRWHDRKIGDLLHPARLGTVELERLKRDRGSLTFSAQYQQSPAPPDGNMVKRVWFRDYDPHDLDRRSMTIVQSWDMALKGDLAATTLSERPGRETATIFTPSILFACEPPIQNSSMRSKHR